MDGEHTLAGLEELIKALDAKISGALKGRKDGLAGLDKKPDSLAVMVEGEGSPKEEATESPDDEMGEMCAPGEDDDDDVKKRLMAMR